MLYSVRDYISRFSHDLKLNVYDLSLSFRNVLQLLNLDSSLLLLQSLIYQITFFLHGIQSLSITLDFFLAAIYSSPQNLPSLVMAANNGQVDTTQPLLNINMVNITKLDSTNFMTWSLQVHSLLDGYDLPDNSTALHQHRIRQSLSTMKQQKIQTTSRSAYLQWSHRNIASVHSCACNKHQIVSRCLEIPQHHVCDSKPWPYSTTMPAAQTLHQRT